MLKVGSFPFAILRLIGAAISVGLDCGLYAPEQLPQRDLLGLLARRLAVGVQPGLQFRDGKFVRNRWRFHKDPDPRGGTYAAEGETAPLEFSDPASPGLQRLAARSRKTYGAVLRTLHPLDMHQPLIYVRQQSRNRSRECERGFSAV